MDWVPLDLKKTKESLERWSSNEERGLWILGYFQGATGALLIGSTPEAFQDGYAMGAEANANSSEHRSRVSKARKEAATKRWTKDAIADANAHAIASDNAKPHAIADANASNHANAHAIASCKTDAQDRQDKTEQQQSRQAGRVSVREWEPNGNHKALADIRGADFQGQLRRFRERNLSQTDTEQGWDVRFNQWLGRSRTEVVEQVGESAPSLEEWMAHGLTFSKANPGPNSSTWPKDLIRAEFANLTGRGWRGVADWRQALEGSCLRWNGLQESFLSRASGGVKEAPKTPPVAFQRETLSEAEKERLRANREAFLSSLSKPTPMTEVIHENQP